MASFPPDIDDYVEQKVQSGAFRSRDEFAAEAVRLYRDLEAKSASLKADIAIGLQEARQGKCEPLDIEELKQELLNDLDEQGNPH